MTTNEKREPSTIGWKIIGELNSEQMQSLPPYAALWLANRITEAVNAARDVRNPGDGLGDGKRICEALGFDPTNHHNALKCPYCADLAKRLPSPSCAADSSDRTALIRRPCPDAAD